MLVQDEFPADVNLQLHSHRMNAKRRRMFQSLLETSRVSTHAEVCHCP
jgi:hypothetical protein